MMQVNSLLLLGIFLDLTCAQSLTANQLWGGINALTQGTDRLERTASGITGLTAVLTTPVRTPFPTHTGAAMINAKS